MIIKSLEGLSKNDLAAIHLEYIASGMMAGEFGQEKSIPAAELHPYLDEARAAYRAVQLGQETAVTALAAFEYLLDQVGKTDTAIGAFATNYRGINGASEFRQLALDLAPQIDLMYSFINKEGQYDEPFDLEFVPDLLHAAADHSHNFVNWQPSMWVALTKKTFSEYIKKPDNGFTP